MTKMKPKTGTITLETFGGNSIYDVLSKAVEKAHGGDSVFFRFNENTFTVQPGETLSDVRARWFKETGIEALTPEESSKRASEYLANMEKSQRDAIANAGAKTEQELREAESPWPKTSAELIAYIDSLVNRPHDYGTCVYAMSLSAVAAFQYVAGKLGVTGFQASCADLDIIRRTRHLKHPFRIVNFGNLLYPQYCTDEKFPTWRASINEPELRKQLRAEAIKCLESNDHAHPEVAAHWKRIASEELF